MTEAKVEAFAVHQMIHGYREGHRLLRSSVALGTDAARTLLVMSDMSGPTMQLGFEEYLTAYPLAQTPYYVLAKTWYAHEMKRPGCVWTHSLLLERSDLGKLTEATGLLASFRRPTPNEVDSSAADDIMIPINGETDCSQVDSSAPSVLSALYTSETRPVLLLGESASQHEALIVRIWLQQWPKLRAAFSFCTGALAPRVCNGVVLDLQVVPRSVSPSQYRKIASSAIVIDPRAHALERDPTTDVLITDIGQGSNGSFRRWLWACAESETSRSLVGRLARIFRSWMADQPPEPSKVLQSIGNEFYEVSPEPTVWPFPESVDTWLSSTV